MKRNRTWLVGIIAGAVLAFSPLFGLLGTLVCMARAFSLLGKSGIGDPKALSIDISGVLYSTAVGLVLFPIGLVLFALSLIFYLRAPNSASLPEEPRQDI